MENVLGNGSTLMTAFRFTLIGLVLVGLYASGVAWAQFDTDPLEEYRKQNKQTADAVQQAVDEKMRHHPSQYLNNQPKQAPEPTAPPAPSNVEPEQPPAAQESSSEQGKESGIPLFTQGIIRLFLDIKASSIFWLLLGIPLVLLIRGQFRLEEEE